MITVALAHVDHPEVVPVMACESRLRQWKDDGSLVIGDAGEIGIAQFLPDTWTRMSAMRKINMDITNPLAQINMIDWAFEHGMQNEWSCYRKLK